MTTKSFFSGFFLLAILFLILAGIGYFSFFIYKTNSVGNKITFEKKNSLLETIRNFSTASNLPLRGAENGRINILLMGIAGKGKPGQNLTDTIMVASVDLKTNRSALVSLPRDLYVKIPETKIGMKINSVYQYGINNFGGEKKSAEMVKEIVTDITGLDINYYIILNFDGFIKIIDAVGGINIMNERDIYDPRYPGPNYSYETFELKKGFHHLDGTTALKYARERHNDPDGDFGRAKRQQKIIETTKNKVFSAPVMINVFAVNEIFNALGDNIKTDVSPNEFESFFELAKKIDTNNINTVVIDAWDKDSLLKVSHIYSDKGRAFILVPRVGNWSETKELAQNVFDMGKIKRRRDEISHENASIVIINKSRSNLLDEKVKKLLTESFNYKNISVIKDYDKSIEESTIVHDLSLGLMPFTLDELILMLSAKTDSFLPGKYKKTIENIRADVVVVLGSDGIEKFDMEEDSFEEYNKSVDANEYTEFLNK